MESEQSRQVGVRLPPWLNGYDIVGFAQEAQLKLHPVDAAAYRWDIETLEQYEHRSARLFEVVHVARAGESPNWASLANLPSSGLSPPIDESSLAEERERRFGDGSGTLTTVAAWVKLITVVAPDADLVSAVQSAYRGLCALSADGAKVFPDAALHFVRCDAALGRRATLARVLMQIEEEPALLETRPEPSKGKTVFGSAWHLNSDLYLSRDAYLAPLFLCLSPWVWGVAGGRVPGVVVYDFGTAIVGRPGEATEFLQLFLPAGTTTSTPRPVIGPTETAAGLVWWVTQLDKLFAEVTDPANYIDSQGEYRPMRQFEMLLSIEQFGRRIQSILQNDRDLATRRLLAFAALDTMQGFSGLTLDDACRLPRTERALQELDAQLPAPVARLLLPTARRAIEGLRACQEGFFLSSRVGSGGVRVPNRRGGERTVPIADTVAQYLRVLRNANHGFTGQDDAGRRRDEILLMAHDGDVPGEFALLPYLYWLELLANPERLRYWLPPRR